MDVRFAAVGAREGGKAGGEQSSSGQGRADPLRTGQLNCSSEVSIHPAVCPVDIA